MCHSYFLKYFPTTFLSFSQSFYILLFPKKKANDAGTNWTPIEDVMLCRSWVEVTHDPIMGNEM